MKDQILLINDLASYGKVALSAMLPVMTHAGLNLYNLPTALVSNTLDYGKFEILETTEYMRKTMKVWAELGFSFDACLHGIYRFQRAGETDFRLSERAERERNLDFCRSHYGR